jgi:hypothetical protein
MDLAVPGIVHRPIGLPRLGRLVWLRPHAGGNDADEGPFQDRAPGRSPRRQKKRVATLSMRRGNGASRIGYAVAAGSPSRFLRYR